MVQNTLIPEDKILTLTFRVEPGCLGPDGTSQIQDFCQFAQDQLSTSNSNFLSMKIIPRYDKSIPELQYQINNKTLSEAQVSRYLNLFNQDISNIEEVFHEELANLIEEYIAN